VTSTAPTPRRWRSRGAAFAWSGSAFALAALGAWLVYETIDQVSDLARAVPPTPPEVATDVIVRNAEDDQGRRASFRILLFTDEFRWRFNSHDALDADPARPLFTDEMKAVLNSAREIICVGASSEEVPAGVPFDIGRRTEERRAGRRAERIALWVRAALSQPIPIRKLNVGHHVPTHRQADTSDQRRVVIIIVLRQDTDANLDQALRSAMAQESARAPIFDTLLTKYSLASGQRFTWVP